MTLVAGRAEQDLRQLSYNDGWHSLRSFQFAGIIKLGWWRCKNRLWYPTLRTVCFPFVFLASLYLALIGGSAAAQSEAGQGGAQRAETMRHYGLDPNSSLESRVRDTSPAVLKMFQDAGVAAPTPHALTNAERAKLVEAFAALPPLHKQILAAHLRSVNFLDGMPNTALTATVNPNEPYRLCDITIRASILRQNASEWLTEKEHTCFSTAGSPLSVSIEAGKRDALVYVLLHEATHIVDMCLRLTLGQQTDKQPAPGESPPGFSDGVWSELALPAPQYRDPLRDRVRFYFGKDRLPVDQARAVYEYLRRTPFVSLYGATNSGDDLAEYAAIFHWTSVLKQPFRIVIRKQNRVVFAYEPMKSDLVCSRASHMKRFYEKERRNGESGGGRGLAGPEVICAPAVCTAKAMVSDARRARS